MTLKIYHQKRDFKKTAEPRGKVTTKKSQKKSLFIIQKHAASHLHYDFRIELNGVLLSWAVPKGPCLDPEVKRLAMHVEDHPLDYGNFEGIIPKGEYGGGTVMLWDKGEWVSEDADPQAAYKKGNMTFSLNAIKLKGRWKLVRTHRDPKSWLLFKITDKYAKPLEQYDITLKKTKSVKTNLSLDAITAKHTQSSNTKPNKKTLKKKPEIKLNLTKSRMPNFIFPELATLVDSPPEGEDWLHEIKFDGYRFIAIKNKNTVNLITRNQNNWTSKFKRIVSAIKELSYDHLILDGEIVVLDENQHANFQLLQNSLKENDHQKFIYYIFDLLYFDKYNLTELPLIERKKILKDVIPSINGPVLRYSDHVLGSGEDIFQKSCELALEGIVSKNIHSIYESKRTRDWLKIKCTKRQEFVICGFTQPKGVRNHFGSLLIGTHDKNKNLIYNGNVGTGFTEKSLKEIFLLLKKNISQQCPFHKIPKGCKDVIWLRPTLVGEVEFSEWTKDNSVRHPSFKGIREDKKPQTIIKEKTIPVKKMKKSKSSVQQSTEKQLPFKLSHPDKILFPEDNFTKYQLAKYYDEAQEYILPYVVNRPLTLVRCPNSYKSCFYQKHIDEPRNSNLHGIKIREKDGSREEYLYIKNHQGLLALPQLGVLEIHPWGSKINNIENPDMVIFDIDPDVNIEWKRVSDAALLIKDYFDRLKMTSFLKTTGGKGLHVVIPIKPEHKWNAVKEFSHEFVIFLVSQHPKEYVSKMNKVLRKDKLFIDYLRNQRGATAIAPYSTRARIHAPISVPLGWDELKHNKKGFNFNLKNIFDRLHHLKKDPWENFLKIKQSLKI